ncbi:methyltransferase domain-containing protein [Kribbella sp. HUAS MG21]|uniref:Methyltransferase domain-containing protein n=1 Tax=Kribbella sp. HUAS MG21 TaxID=3160966 RepID=A0AAU7T3D7_9ACTN
MGDRERIERNRSAWDLRAAAHLWSEFYDIDGFRAGRSSLRSFELETLGDVRGQRLLHLMCDFGLDTLSWARLGAEVTGVDFSGEAIAAARALAAEAGLAARFVQADVYDAADVLEPASYDVVVATYGVLVWLPSLDEFARVIARLLRPGGVVFLADFHPMQSMVDEDLRVRTSYFRSGAVDREVTVSYTGQVLPEHGQSTWPWTVGGLVNALAGAGLRIEQLHELPVDLRQRSAAMVQGTDGLWRLPGDPVPLLLTCRAVRDRSAVQAWAEVKRLETVGQVVDPGGRGSVVGERDVGFAAPEGVAEHGA